MTTSFRYVTFLQVRSLPALSANVSEERKTNSEMAVTDL